MRLENKFGLKCDHYFGYKNSGPTNHVLQVQINNCEPVNYALMASSVLVTTFLLGFLLIMVIRYLVKIKDAQEYARFEQEQKESVLQESPLYRNPVSHYVVPSKINRKDSNPFL